MMRMRSRLISGSRPGYPDLREIVQLIPRNSWDWILFEFNAFGPPFKGIPLEELEDRVLDDQSGYRMSYDDFVELAETVQQTVDILAVAVETIDGFNGRAVLQGNFDECNFVIRIFDSTEVILGVDDQVCDVDSILRAFMAL